jgi:hypothetical protein
MDLYCPADAPSGTRLPAVVLVTGYNDVGYEKMLGVKFKEMALAVSWAQLIAASGQIAITYTNREPAADLTALLQHVREQAAALGVDADRVGLWACSGHVPLALAALMAGSTNGSCQSRPGLQCAALLYGYMLDLDGATGVADAAGVFRFTNPNCGKTMDDLPDTLPLFIVRAGQDQLPHLNESIDRCFAKALTLNRPITLVNHSAGTHSFDVLDDSDTSRMIIRQVLDFLGSRLATAGASG